MMNLCSPEVVLYHIVADLSHLLYFSGECDMLFQCHSSVSQWFRGDNRKKACSVLCRIRVECCNYCIS
jgi:hypothetical protein